MSTKIHATCDALGNPTGFFLTPGQAHDLHGADALLPDVEAAYFLADKAYDADERVLKILEEKGNKQPRRKQRGIESVARTEPTGDLHITFDRYYCPDS